MRNAYAAPRLPHAPHPAHPRAAVPWVALVVLACAAAGCSALSVPEDTATMAQVDRLAVNASQLRARVFAYGQHFSRTVEQAADEIMVATTDPDVRRQALAWKTYTLPAMHLAAVKTDPFIALIDVWALSVQMRQFFEAGEGREMFGPLHDRALQAAIRLEGDAEVLARSAVEPGTDITVVRDRIYEWAEQHPLEPPHFVRPSLLVPFFEMLGQEGTGALATLGSTEATVRELADRLAFLNEYALKGVQWQTELLLGRTLGGYAADSLLGAMQASLVGVSTLTGELPALLEREREAVLAALTGERIAIMEGVTGERIAILEGVTGEREAVLAALQQERIAVLAALHDERVATMADLEGLVLRTLEASNGVVDHIFWRAAQLLFVLGLGLVLAAFALVWFWRTGRR